ncbi:hypothetical protein BN1708_004951 [Verticillium longisporum]|uniref:Uncharacterized protein n=1 Tax=Verticillium longisporum TaxID=100787 RepID=A0A0G4M539_VERLO|nr:hypothetical protein BN1708_004951 [Verticillium longisporum]
MSAQPNTPLSPKTARVKSPAPGMPIFGCEHVQMLLSQSQDTTNQSVHHYKMILRNIFEQTPLVPQTSKNNDGQPVTSLTANYLCLQCSSIVSEEERLKHGNKKQHRFYVDSRSGTLYCQICDDLVWDPTLEDLRVRKMGTGTFSKELHERNGDGKPPEIGSEHSCNCIIHQTFYGKLQSTTTCQNCGGVTNAVQSFLDLSLGLDNLAQRRARKTGQKQPSLTLQECLDEEYVKSDKCEYRCHNCDSTQQARRNTSIKRLPNVLAIQLKRFEFKQGRHDRAPSKIDTTVNFPLQLNMLPYTNRAKGSDTKESFELARSCTYDLLSVVVHVGEIDTGHYVSYCRVADQWFKFNDHKVEMASKSDVLSAQPYLLFYIIRSLS